MTTQQIIKHSSPDCGYPSLTATWCFKCYSKYKNMPNQIKEKIIEILKEAEQGIGNQDYDKDAEKYADQIFGLFKKENQAQREDLLEKIEKMKKDDYNDFFEDGYNQALEDIKKLI